MGKTEYSGKNVTPSIHKGEMEELSTALDQLDLKNSSTSIAADCTEKKDDCKTTEIETEKCSSDETPTSTLDAASNDGNDNVRCDAKIVNTEETVNSVAAPRPPSAESCGEESDEDNENVVIGDGCSVHGTDEVDYQERGPCKVTRSHYSSRYNPMDDMLDLPGFQLPEPLLAGPLSPEQQELVTGYDTPPQYHQSPVYAPAYATTTAPANDYGAYSATTHGPSYGSGSPTLPAAFYSSVAVGALSVGMHQYANNSLPTNYLDVLDDVVDHGLGEQSDGTSPSNVHHIMDGLHSIDPAELDYISPCTPASAGENMEEYLSLTPDDDSEHTLDTYTNATAALGAFRDHCNNNSILRAAMRMMTQSAQELCSQDQDGDTCYIIVACKTVDSPKFYDNLFMLQQHLQKLKICCGSVVEDTDHCPLCGASSDQWHTPLSLHNNAYQSALLCALKLQHPALVINYLCAGLTGCPQDMTRVFDGPARLEMEQYTYLYPVLNRFL